jgi:hypothetical protein
MRSFWCRATRQWVPEEEWRGPALAPTAPMIMKDIAAYRSPIDRTVISTRAAHRDHLKRHRVVELGNEQIKPKPARTMPPLREDLMRAYDKVTSGRK